MENNANAYSEVIEILKLLEDEKKLEALPIDMLEVLKSKANPEYQPQISKEIPIDEQDLLPETYSILSWIAMKYWSDEINEEIVNNENLNAIQEEVKVQENIAEFEDEVDNSDKAIENEQEDTSNNNLPILQSDLRWYQKIKAKIIALFNKIFKKNRNEQYSEEN